MTDEEFRGLIGHVDDVLGILMQHPDEATREQIAALLQGLDAIHREGLTRLVTGLRQRREFEALCGDPVIEVLLGLYGLVELNLPEPRSLVQLGSRRA
jgi:hypothetical protein